MGVCNHNAVSNGNSCVHGRRGCLGGLLVPVRYDNFAISNVAFVSDNL